MIFPAINLHLFWGFSMAMLNNQMVIYYIILIVAAGGLEHELYEFPHMGNNHPN